MRLLPCAITSLCFVSAHAQSLDELEANSRVRPANFEGILANEPVIREGVQKLIQNDVLRTAEEFRRAGMLQMGANQFQEPTLATGYQLLLTGAVLGDKEAVKHLGLVWD